VIRVFMEGLSRLGGASLVYTLRSRSVKLPSAFGRSSPSDPDQLRCGRPVLPFHASRKHSRMLSAESVPLGMAGGLEQAAQPVPQAGVALPGPPCPAEQRAVVPPRPGGQERGHSERHEDVRQAVESGGRQRAAGRMICNRHFLAANTQNDPPKAIKMTNLWIQVPVERTAFADCLETLGPY